MRLRGTPGNEIVVAPSNLIDHSMPPEIWHRWFRGPVKHERPNPTSSSQIAVVVIGYRAQKGLVAAVTSLVNQVCQAEIVVVNSGGGDAIALLQEFSGRIRIIDIEEPLRVGAARNIGIDASEAPYVAFLAGDCIAKPGWASARLRKHASGSRAVASAIAVPEGNNVAALAAHLLLFGLRSPQIHPAHALRYGVSYRRDVFAEFGYFNSVARIAEDSGFSQRLGRGVFPAWVPEVQTGHANSRTLSSLVRDLYLRGVRAAPRSNGAHESQRWFATLRAVINNAGQRTSAARKIARDYLGFDSAKLAAIGPLLSVGSLAYCLGLARGTARLGKARSLMAQAYREASVVDIKKLEDAVSLDFENIPLRLACAEANEPVSSEKARMHLQMAMDLSCFHSAKAQAMMEWLQERNREDDLETFIARLQYCLPTGVVREQAALSPQMKH